VWAASADDAQSALREHRKGRAWAAEHVLLGWIDGEPATTVGEFGRLLAAIAELGRSAKDLAELRILDVASAITWLRDALDKRLAQIETAG
jgi:hypothetical protein